MKYSIIIPVYNRPDEIDELLQSLTQQTCKDFEVIIVEDGSTIDCKSQVGKYSTTLDITYITKPNEGRSIARNTGVSQSHGQYLVFFDSDCVIPPRYFEILNRELDRTPLDCYGGPDAAHDSFTDTQKAINYTMTSFLTTGGIRGGRINLEKFVPRTFNMGFKRSVFDHVGGFREMFSEDIDMSTRIRNASYTIGLIQNPVWHKRRVNFKKFLKQVYIFGKSRITLKLLYPDSLKIVHALPAVFVIGVIALLILSIFVSPWWLLPLAAYLCAIVIGALIRTRSIKIALLALPAALIQLGGYGIGFIRDYTLKIILRQGRNADEEIQLRKGQ